jgi:hypothetical protein
VGAAAAVWAASTPTATPTTGGRYPTEYALANDVDHPRTVYIREDDVVRELDPWIARVFDLENVGETCDLLTAASAAGDVDEASREAARRKLDDCDTRLAGYRSALESGANPSIVAKWITEVQGDRIRAGQALAAASRASIEVDEVRAWITALGPMGPVLKAAEPIRNEPPRVMRGL